ncbi:MAG: helix-hairpin-helix domain-containing protein, partial [Pirellulales bacterium]|nr:helix-hairpin-helix domain-containing protein [Pirellulales bacterium]
AKNLRNLLLQPPVHGRRVLALDPGFRSGAKMVALDEFGNPMANDVMHIVGSEERLAEGRKKLVAMIKEHELNVVAIGNGTACRETEKLVGQVLADELSGTDIGYAVVNEAGASVYSTSQLGRDEFPDYDATVRGAVSIGRRLLDPLSELVKIDPASIGVGLYQHDVKAKHLRESLDAVVESCVNFVGVDVNAASPALLRYVSGMNQLTAQRVFDHRKEHGPFRNRQQLLEVPGLGEAKFVQAAGFLKIAGGDNPLDASWIHPESYEVANRVLAKLGAPVNAEAPSDSDRETEGDSKPDSIQSAIADVDREQLAGELEIGPLLLNDILTDLTRPGRDPREDLPPPIFRHEVLKLEDLEKGMELAGTVLNVVDFGAFIDIGLHDSALVHISQLGSRYVRDPHDVVSVGDVVKVWVMSTDKERRRVALTMIEPGTEQPKQERATKQRRNDDGSRPASKGKGSPKTRGGKRTRSQTSRKPKPKPKPVVPLTEGMKKGSEPMRTFGDLAQFVELKKDEEQPSSDPGDDKS